MRKKSSTMCVHWICLVCNAKNRYGDDYCSDCGCLVNVNSSYLDGWKKSLTSDAEKPTVDLNNFILFGELSLVSLRTALCPKCKLHMYITDSSCPHCKYKLSLEQRHNLYENAQSMRKKAVLIGVPLFTMLLFLIVFMISFFI